MRISLVISFFIIAKRDGRIELWCPLIRMTIGQGPSIFAVGAIGFVLIYIFLSSCISFIYPSLRQMAGWAEILPKKGRKSEHNITTAVSGPKS